MKTSFRAKIQLAIMAVIAIAALTGCDEGKKSSKDNPPPIACVPTPANNNCQGLANMTNGFWRGKLNVVFENRKKYQRVLEGHGYCNQLTSCSHLDNFIGVEVFIYGNSNPMLADVYITALPKDNYTIMGEMPVFNGSRESLVPKLDGQIYAVDRNSMSFRILTTDIKRGYPIEVEYYVDHVLIAKGEMYAVN